MRAVISGDYFVWVATKDLVCNLKIILGTPSFVDDRCQIGPNKQLLLLHRRRLRRQDKVYGAIA